LSLTLKIALVSSDHEGRPAFPLLLSVFHFHIDQFGKEVEVLQGLGIGNVVNEEEGVRGQVRGRPHAAIFFLACSIGEEEGVGLAIDGARDRVRVFDCGIVVVDGVVAVTTERYLPQPPSPQMVIEILSSIVDAQLSSCEGCRSNKVQGVEVA
ncbi:hypothetical protein KCV07_g242, partial [Aureobasidium melanogenum]